MRTTIVRLMIMALAALVLSGCSWDKTVKSIENTTDSIFDTRPTAQRAEDEDDTPIIELNYQAAEEIAADIKNDIHNSSPLRIRAFRNISHPADQSPFGQIVAQQLAARLAQLDYKVMVQPPTMNRSVDANATDSGLFGEEKPVVPSVIDGGYYFGDNVIYCTATVSAEDNGEVFSGWQWTLPINNNTRALLPSLTDPKAGITPTTKTRF